MAKLYRRDLFESVVVFGFLYMFVWVLLVGCGTPTPPAKEAVATEKVFDASGQTERFEPTELETERLQEREPERKNECELQSKRCVDGKTQQCEKTPEGDIVWGTPEECLGSTPVCQQGVCVAPSAKQQRWLRELNAYVQILYDRSGSLKEKPVAIETLKQEIKDILWKGGGSTISFFRAARHGLLAFKGGHSAIHSNGLCGSDDFPLTGVSRYGVCAKPYQDHFIVVSAKQGNVLGLQRGDRITSVDGKQGKGMIQQIIREPLCGETSSSNAHDHIVAATSLFSSFARGKRLKIVRASGQTEEKVIVAAPGERTVCNHPPGRKKDQLIESYLRPDGIGVVRVSGFYVPNAGPIQTNEDLVRLQQKLQEQILKAFTAVKQAKALIWDVRSNGGGFSPVALRIVDGMPGAKAMDLSSCTVRVPASHPPRFQHPQAFYRINPGGPFEFKGKVAVLIDGFSFSATDYFAYAVAKATNVPLFGKPTAGAFGGSMSETVSQDPNMLFAFDPFRCVDAAGLPLEGKSVIPTYYVEHTPENLQKGVDSVMEAAAKWLQSN